MNEERKGFRGKGLRGASRENPSKVRVSHNIEEEMGKKPAAGGTHRGTGKIFLPPRIHGFNISV